MAINYKTFMYNTKNLAISMYLKLDSSVDYDDIRQMLLLDYMRFCENKNLDLYDVKNVSKYLSIFFHIKTNENENSL